MPFVMNNAFPPPRYVQQVYAAPMTDTRGVATDNNGTWVVVGSEVGNAEVYTSTDRLNWTQGTFVGSPVPPFGIVGENVASDGAGTWIMTMNDRQLIYKSTDNGATWNATNVPPGINGDYGIVLYSNAGDTWFALGNGYVKSTDGGDTWTEFFSLAPGHGAFGSYESAAISSTRTVVNGLSGRDDYTDDGSVWLDAGMTTVGHSGGWYEDTVGIYAFVNTQGNVQWSLTGNSSWTVTDIIAANSTEFKFIIFSPQDNKWIASTSTNLWYQTVDTGVTSWEPVPVDQFNGVNFGRSGDSDGSHYMVVTDNNLIVTK